MKKLLLLLTILISLVTLSISANAALGELPEPTLYGYVYKCDTCKTKWASDKQLETPNDCPYSNCDGQRYEQGLCSKEYFYFFKCGYCEYEKEYRELPQATAEGPYGLCPANACKKVVTEDMFRIDYGYMQYSMPCFYCLKVYHSPFSIDEDTESCPFCSKPYYTPFPDSVDDNGNLIYGGGGSDLYYCTTTDKFYEAVEIDEDNTDNSCPYCDKHDPKQINILYCTTCPSCGTKAERIYLACYNTPYLTDSIVNAFIMIGINITGELDPTDFEVTNRCYECNYEFSNATSLTITRHVDAPDDAVYESHANDRDYHETERYLEYGSEYDNFLEKIVWWFKNIVYKFKMILKDLTA